MAVQSHRDEAEAPEQREQRGLATFSATTPAGEQRRRSHPRNTSTKTNHNMRPNIPAFRNGACDLDDYIITILGTHSCSVATHDSGGGVGMSWPTYRIRRPRSIPSACLRSVSVKAGLSSRCGMDVVIRPLWAGLRSQDAGPLHPGARARVGPAGPSDRPEANKVRLVEPDL